MTPAINQAVKHQLAFKTHQYSHDPAAESYGLEAAEKLGVDAARVFKTLVVLIDGGELAVAIVPVSGSLNMKKIAKALAVKKATMAPAADVERSSGYVLGGVSPLGQKKRLRTVLDLSAQQQATIFVSAGKRGLEIELSPKDLAGVLNATLADISA